MPDLPVSHAWEPITDLPQDWEAIARPDLTQMLELWQREQASLRDPGKVALFSERLARLWSIETGVLEHLYTVDRGVTETLVERGLEALETFSSTGRIERHVAALIQDQRAALDFVFSYIKDERPLTLSYIKELHQLLLRRQEFAEAVDTSAKKVRTALIRGDWKKLPNNPVTTNGSIHEYCPADFVQDEMETLLRLHGEHERHAVRPEVEAAWLHHRFAQIHPFQDGNGRVARALATMLFVKHGFLPLVIRRDNRETYLRALEAADAGSLAPLVNLFANIQTEDLEDAVTFIREIRGAGIARIASAAAEAAKRRMQRDEESVVATTERLVVAAQRRLSEVAYELGAAFRESGVTLSTTVQTNEAENESWWNHQIVEAAREYRYFAALSQRRGWVRLSLRVPTIGVPRWHIVVSFHHKESRSGLMAAVVFLTGTELGLGDPRPVILGSDREFTYSAVSVRPDDEFKKWLEVGITRLLEDWQSRV